MLEITSLSKSYPNGTHALRGVTLSIGPGLFGLLGPNGAGKSSLMRTLATLQPPDEGTIRLDSRDIFADAEGHRRRLGYLPQDFGVYPGVSALALLNHLAILKGVRDRAARREQIDALLARTNLYDHRRKAVDTYSGGMRRRFGIAQALLGDPRLIIVDEPTAGLDPEERNRFHDLLGEIGERVTLILSTHIVEDVRQLCARVAVLAGGRIVLDGDPEGLVAQLRGRIWSRTVDREELDRCRATLRVLSTQRYSGKVRVRVLADASPGPDFQAAEPDLEDAYFAALDQKAG